MTNFAIIFRYSVMDIKNVKLCRAKNVCWNLKEKRLEMSVGLYPHSTLPKQSDPYFTTLSGMRDNLFVVWFPHSFSTISKDLKIAWVEDKALLMKRYLPVNTMHLLHDEVLPGLATILHHKNLREANEDRLIVTLDDVGETQNDELLEWLGQLWRLNNLQASLRLRHGFAFHEHLDYICFNESYVGMDSPSTSWYQYGFENPQGPIKSSERSIVGKNVRTAVEWIKDELMGVESKLTESHVKDLQEILLGSGATSVLEESRPIISIITRSLTRLILNENELRARLEGAFPRARVQFIQQETMSIEDLVWEISNSVVLLGMHGALLSLSVFLPPKAVLIELFPFGIPAENYTPYRTLANLPHMDLKYAAWTNPHEAEPFNVGHPERPYTEGGLKAFTESYKQGILATKTVPVHQCCYSPFWLYRIFQDTRVDSDEIIRLIKSKIKE